MIVRRCHVLFVKFVAATDSRILSCMIVVLQSSRTDLDDDVVDVMSSSLSALDVVERKMIVVFYSSRTVFFAVVVVVSSRTDPDDDVVDVTSFSALDVVELKSRFCCCRRCRR